MEVEPPTPSGRIPNKNPRSKLSSPRLDFRFAQAGILGFFLNEFIVASNGVLDPSYAIKHHCIPPQGSAQDKIMKMLHEINLISIEMIGRLT